CLNLFNDDFIPLDFNHLYFRAGGNEVPFGHHIHELLAEFGHARWPQVRGGVTHRSQQRNGLLHTRQRVNFFNPFGALRRGENEPVRNWNAWQVVGQHNCPHGGDREPNAELCQRAAEVDPVGAGLRHALDGGDGQTNDHQDNTANADEAESRHHEYFDADKNQPQDEEQHRQDDDLPTQLRIRPEEQYKADGRDYAGCRCARHLQFQNEANCPNHYQQHGNDWIAQETGNGIQPIGRCLPYLVWIEAVERVNVLDFR